MSKRDIGAEILDGIEEIKAFKKGNVKLKVTEILELQIAEQSRKFKAALKTCSRPPQFDCFVLKMHEECKYKGGQS